MFLLIFRIFVAWLAIGLMMFFAALLVDMLRGEEVGVDYLMLHRKGALLLLLAWPWAFGLVLIEMRRAGKDDWQ